MRQFSKSESELWMNVLYATRSSHAETSVNQWVLTSYLDDEVIEMGEEDR